MASDLKKFLYPKFLETIDPALSSHFSARHFLSGTLPINFDADRSAVSTALLQLFQEEVMGRNKGIVAELFRVADIGNSKWMQTILNEGRRKDVVLDRDLGLNQGDPAAAKPDQKHVALETYVYRPSIFKAAADFHASRVPAVLAELRRPQRNVGACLSEVAAEAFKSSAIKLLARDLQEAQISISGCILRSIPERERDELLRARLTEQPKGDIWSVCSYFDCGLDVRPIREIGRQLHACCPHDIAEDELLKSDDLRRFRIDADRLMRALPASTDLTALASQIADRLWSLGRLPSGRCLAPGAEVRSLGRRRRANLALRSAARSAPPVALTTDIDAATDVRSREGGVGTSPFPASIAVDAGGTEHLTLGRISPGIGTPRLVLSRSRQSAMLEGRRLDLPLQMFALFRLLAEQAGQWDAVLRKEAIDAQTGRPAKEIVRDLRKTLVGCGLTRAEANALVATVHGFGYRLGLEAAEIAIGD